MKNQHNKKSVRISIWVTFFCLTFVNCTHDHIAEELNYNNQTTFSLNFPNAEQTRSVLNTALDVRYLLVSSDGTLVRNIQSDFHAESSTIVMEPLPKGKYTLCVLAYDRALAKDGFRLNEYPGSIDEEWFTLGRETAPILASGALYYGRKAFEVSAELRENHTIELSPILAAITVHRNISSKYLLNSIQDVELSAPQKSPLCSSFSVNGEWGGSIPLANTSYSIKDKHSIYLMPQASQDSISLSFTTTTKDHKGERYKISNQTMVKLTKGEKNNVYLNYSKHPDSKVGTLYISRAFYNESERGLILQDNEPQRIFYDEKQRSFRINQLLQVSQTADGALQSRFYSPVAIKNVSIWGDSRKYRERVLLAYYDSIPAFCNAQFYFSEQETLREFFTASNAKISLDKEELADLLSSKLTIESEDRFWTQVTKIDSRWFVRFSSFGGNPDARDGAPAGNWMGIRPVHIREGIAFLINCAYMISTPEFATHLEGFQGEIWGNGGKKDIIDVRQILPKLKAHSGFNLGLIYSGRGVNGLGGGRTLGVYQPSYLNHYDAPYFASIFFHEIGHCLGYSHDSGMTYGPWAEKIANQYYVTNCRSFPVPFKTILNSKTNKNIYP